MRAFTENRDAASRDQIWLVEHPAVYTLGRRGAGYDIGDLAAAAEVVQSDRGGLITWHGPGQIVLYWLADIKRLQIGVRALVSNLEQSVVNLLAGYGVAAQPRADAPGVYLSDGAKIASLGLRVRRGCSYHGLALNVCNDLEPFAAIQPCGLTNVSMSSLQTLDIKLTPAEAGRQLADYLIAKVYAPSSA